MRLVAAVLAVLVTASCSSAPKRQDERQEMRNRAAELSRLGNEYLRKGDTEQALRLFTLALAYNGAADHHTGLVESYNSIGKVHLARGAVEEATRHFGQALRIAEDLGDEVLIAKSRNNLGEAAFARGDFAASLELFEQAASARGLSDTDRAVVMHNCGSAFRRLGRAAEAEASFEAALAINTREKVWAEAASNCYMLALLASERGDYGNALRLALLALENDRRVENALGIGKDYMALGQISTRRGDIEAALGYFERAVFVYRSFAVVEGGRDLRRELSEAALQAAEAAERLGRFDVAGGYRSMLEQRGSSP